MPARGAAGATNATAGAASSARMSFIVAETCGGTRAVRALHGAPSVRAVCARSLGGEWRGDGVTARSRRRQTHFWRNIPSRAVSTENPHTPSAQRSRHAGGSKQLQQRATAPRQEPRHRRARASSCFCRLVGLAAAYIRPTQLIFARKALRGRMADTFRQWIASTMISCSVAYDFYAG